MREIEAKEPKKLCDFRISGRLAGQKDGPENQENSNVMTRKNQENRKL